MTSWTESALTLLAEGDPFGNMGRNFRGEEAQVDFYEVTTGLAFLVALVVGALLLTKLLSRQDRLRRCNSPRSLFKELCRAHSLSRHERQLLKQLSLDHGLEDPLSLFLDPSRFRDAGLLAAWQPRRQQVRDLGERLFGAEYLAEPNEKPVEPATAGSR